MEEATALRKLFSSQATRERTGRAVGRRSSRLYRPGKRARQPILCRRQRGRFWRNRGSPWPV